MIEKAKKQLLLIKGNILLGLSGGPDSMFLCELLRECKIAFHIAHVDHGILEDSNNERQRLEVYAKKYDIPFHYCRLIAKDFPTCNLEDFLREKRYEYFKSLILRYNLDVLVLGHQKDEKVETIIKRFFEGGNVFNLFGINKYAEYKDIKVIRPLLEISKKQIIQYLEEKNIAYFVDPTNFIGNNLRARMRKNLIPELEQRFGKNITSSISDIGDQMNECAAFVNREVEVARKIMQTGAFGTFFPYTEEVDDYIYMQMIFQMVKEKKIQISREQRAFIKKGIWKKVVGKKILFSSYQINFEKEGLFFVEGLYENPILSIMEEDISWMTFWKEGWDNPLIKKISNQKYTKYLDKKKFSEYHRRKKTPIFLRSVFPISLTTIPKKIKIASY